ncbi:MAG: glycosyltransferase [Rickettsiales bacterium]|jgi:glycosyltransferase involved in cell wall biosynthesis|nr:glycosyltransferase [Rickettsiales bacterium]
MIQKPILSLCIPTYNNSDAVFAKIQRILASKSKLFQIVISDNRSDDDILEKLSKVKDSRLKIVVLPENRGSVFNIMNAYANADGMYAMICMDKDGIRPENLDSAISILKDGEINFGYFALKSKNTQIEKAVCLTKNSDDCLLKFGYRAMHPSGTFFKTQIIRDLFGDFHLADANIVDGFITDFMLAEASKYGNGAVLDFDFMEIDAPPFKGKKHSDTYSPARGNVFFCPENR